MGRCDINSPVLKGGCEIKRCVHNKVDTFQQQCFSVCGVVFCDDRGVAATKTCQNIVNVLLGISPASILTPGKYPKEHLLYSNHGESLKSTICQNIA
jgi:hypothetical protein